VIEMADSASMSYLTPEFDDFLFARINEDGNATPLSVLSMLARLGVDPWEEAAKLAQLPRGSAAQKLVAFVAATPGVLSEYLNAETVSVRLIDLLPRPAVSVITPPKGRGILRFAIWPVLIAVILAIQLLAIRQPSTPANEPHATSSSTMTR